MIDIGANGVVVGNDSGVKGGEMGVELCTRGDGEAGLES